MVGLWEVRPDQSLAPVASSMTDVPAEDATPEVGEALRLLHMPAPRGSRWVAGHLAKGGQWCVAPVRNRVPDPPPLAGERRSRERLALELAGLCLGLSDQLGVTSRAAPVGPDQYVQFVQQLGTFAHDIAHPLGAARAALARLDDVLRHPQDRTFHDRLLEDARTAQTAVEATMSLARRVQDHARAILALSGDFDLVPVVWSVVEAERPRAAGRGVTLEVNILGYLLPVTGDAGEFERVLSLLIRNGVESLGGRPGTLTLSLENMGPVVRITYRLPAAVATSALDEVRQVVETRFGGDLAVASDPGTGTVVTVRVAVRQERLPEVGRGQEG